MITLILIWLLCAVTVGLIFCICYLPFVIFYSLGDVVATLLELLLLVILSPVVLVIGILYVFIILLFDGVTWIANKFKHYEDC